MKQSDGPRQLHNLSSSSKINWNKYKMKGYFHFDDPIYIQHMKRRVQNPDWVSSYAFLPFIHFEIIFKRYGTKLEDNQKIRDEKVREIFYAAHKDQFIYKYYGELLNYSYNEYAEQHGINNIAVAYRNNKKQNNIDFSFEVFDFLFEQQEALVISLDFTSFFDNINHSYLKRNLKEVLNVEELEEDWYQVFKHTTKYSYIDKYDVDEFLKDKYGIKKFNAEKSKMKITPREFRKLKRKALKINRKRYGIPQGSGMSAVCSNVHLIHFDRQLKDWAVEQDALYRRYSDDLILVIPCKISDMNYSKLKNQVLDIVKKFEEYGLSVQDKKTEIRLYEKGRIKDEDNSPSTLDYLGFVTDGETLRLREKSLFKYYSRAYRKAKTSKRISEATKRPGPKRELYDIYTHLGFNYKGLGNFTTYAYKAHKKMSQLKTKSMIRQQIKRHWNRIHKRMR